MSEPMSLGELGPEHAGQGGHYAEFLADKLVQSAEEPPDFVDKAWLSQPDVVWRHNESVPGWDERKRLYDFADFAELSPITPPDWLEQVAACGANKPRLRLAEEIAKYADFDTGRNVRPSNVTIANSLGLTRKAVNEGVRRLINAGWLTATGKSAKGVIVYALTVPLGLSRVA